MPQRPFASITMTTPPGNCRGQLYNGQDLPNSETPFYQQFMTANTASQTPVSSAMLPVTINPQEDGNRFGPQPGYQPAKGSVLRESNFSGDSRGFKFLQQGYDGFESSGLWSDWSKPGNAMGSLLHLSSSTAVPKPIISLGFSANHFGVVSLLIHEQIFTSNVHYFLLNGKVAFL